MSTRKLKEVKHKMKIEIEKTGNTERQKENKEIKYFTSYQESNNIQNCHFFLTYLPDFTTFYLISVFPKQQWSSTQSPKQHIHPTVSLSLLNIMPIINLRITVGMWRHDMHTLRDNGA